METIKVSSKDRYTSIRLTQRTKKMLDTQAHGKETHDEIIRRLVKLAIQFDEEAGTAVFQKGRAIATRYERLNRKLTIETEDHVYVVVCTFNDLTIQKMLQSRAIRNRLAHGESPEWELDLQIENFRINGSGWRDPSVFKKNNVREFVLIYLVCVKQILEEFFDISLYEVDTKTDYFSYERWKFAYKRNGLSNESFYSDIQAKLKGLT